MDSWLDKLPAYLKKEAREKYKMSAGAYERWREKVRDRGPQFIEKEKRKNEAMAHLTFAMESEPHIKDALKKQIEKDIAEQGIEAVLNNSDLSTESRQQIEAGRFDIAVDAPTQDEPDQLVLCPEGNVGEKCAVKATLSESYASQLQGNM